MTYRVIHFVKDKNMMKVFVNSRNELYINISTEDDEDGNYICLDKSEVTDLIDELKDLVTEVE